MSRFLPAWLLYLVSPKFWRLVKGLRRIDAAHEAHQRGLATRLSTPGGGA